MTRTPSVAAIFVSTILLTTLACVPEGRDMTDVGDGEDRHLSADEIASQPRDGEFVRLSPIDVEGAARAVALVVLAAPGDAPRLEARAGTAGAFGEWKPLAVTWSEEDHHVAAVDLEGAADQIELRIEAASLELLSSLRWSAASSPQPAEEGAFDTTSSGLRSELSGLGIVTRSQWGARAPRCSMTNNASKTRMAIHHTEGPSANPQRQLRSIQQFHANKGWCDIGYHFLIDTSGTIYEGRELSKRGVHARNNNTGNIGISHIGSFISTNPPTAMTNSTSRLIARLSSIYGIQMSRTRIKGHREYSSTDCPGARLYARIDSIIADARTGGGGTPPPPPPGGACLHTLGGTYDNLGCSADYQCCSGSWRTKANGCGTCVCTEATGRSGCQAPAPPPPPPPPPGGSCTHSFGGQYTHLGCSADYQCCNGSWQTQANGCGSCACTEATGQVGCGAPPAGASCTHSFGGTYSHLACSTSYQCCDGSWRTRSSGGCGTCTCEEGTGTQGCGGGGTSPPPPMTMNPYLGLSTNGSDIPRAGLSNATLRSALGISTEPLGTVVTHDGVSWVRGRVSSFGGPNDTGVSSTETGAITGERLRSLNNPMSPSSSTLASRPEDYYYAAMRWAYSPNGRSFWASARFVVVNQSTGRTIVVRAVDWGPHTRTQRVIDLSPQSLRDLGVSTDDNVLVAFAPPGTALGVVR